jgi:hypothetical protein
MQLGLGNGHVLCSPRQLLVGALQAVGSLAVATGEVLQPAASPLGLIRHALLEARRSRIFRSGSGGQPSEASFV